MRARVSGSAKRPRFSVFRSNRYVYAQLIDDGSHKTLVSSSNHPPDVRSKGKKKAGISPESVGVNLAEKAVKMGIREAVFDRGGYKYHGNIKKVAEGARKAGLKF